MRRFAGMVALLVGTTLAVACGNDGDNNGGPIKVEDRTGTGSETLRVTASIQISGDGTSQNLAAGTTIAIKDQQGIPASAAVVTLSWLGGDLELLEDPAGTGIFVVPGGSTLPWSEAYALTVERGADTLEGVTIASPALHEITAPQRFDNHYAQQPLDVEWTGADTADQFRVELDANQSPHTAWQDGDPGSFRIEGQFFAPATGAYTEIVTVRRKKTLALTGTLPQSSLAVEIQQDIDPIAINPPQ